MTEPFGIYAWNAAERLLSQDETQAVTVLDGAANRFESIIDGISITHSLHVGLVPPEDQTDYGNSGDPYGYTGEWWTTYANRGILYLRARYLAPYPTAKYVSTHMAKYYPENAEMQSNFKRMPDWRVVYELTDPEVNVETVAATVRMLADFRFGSNDQPLTTSHRDLSQWTLADAAVLWHGYRYGVPDAGPKGRGEGFAGLEFFQDRHYTWRIGLQRGIFLGDDAERSIREAVPFLQCSLERCD